MLVKHTLREYDGTEGTYMARRDIPPLWTVKVGWWRRMVEAFKAWQYGEGR